jgi:4-hydroxy-tetrahydrodipicolinate synthase
MSIKKALYGIIPPIVTPLKNDNELDEEGLEKLIKHLLNGGVHGIFLLGTTGEGTSLRYKLREKFIRQACSIIDKKVPVMVGITDTSFDGSIEIAHICKDAGADSLVVAPPYYFPITDIEMLRYLDDLVAELPLPFLLYNIPSHTKLHMSVETVKHAKDLGALGIKDSSGDMLYMIKLISNLKESDNFSFITGTEIFIPETILQGGHGAIAGGANMFPKLFVDFYNASVEKDLIKIDLLRQIVMKIYNTIYNVGNFSSRYTVGTKCALATMGICNNYVAHPLRKFHELETKAISKYIEEINYMIEIAANPI